MSNPGAVDYTGSISGTTGVVSKTFTDAIGAIYLLNSGSNAVWVTLDGTDPVASDGVGRFQIPPGLTFNLEDAQIVALKAISTAAFTVQYVAMRRGS